MRFYTKEWSTLMDSLGTIDLFRPVIDKDYSDEEIEELYQEFMDRYVEEERASYDEPPLFTIDDDDDYDEEDARDDVDSEELDGYVRSEMLWALNEYENREPFDEEEAREEFEENYNDFLEEPDEDIPKWILDSVDRRLLAMGALPEGAYKKLMAEEEAMQERFDELDEAADEALEEMYSEMPDEYEGIMDDLDELDGDYVIALNRADDELELVLSGWDDEGEPVKRTAVFDGVTILEDEGIRINAEVDEDGDWMSDCDLEYHELYFEDNRFEVHLMFDDGELKYLTFACDDISIVQSRFDD